MLIEWDAECHRFFLSQVIQSNKGENFFNFCPVKLGNINAKSLTPIALHLLVMYFKPVS